MAKRQATIRKLPAVETLGSATIGYRPEGEFLYGERQVEPLNAEHISLLLTIGSLNNNARLRQVAEAGRAADESRRQKSWDIIGDPTEGALVVAAMKAGLTQVCKVDNSSGLNTTMYLVFPRVKLRYNTCSSRWRLKPLSGSGMLTGCDGSCASCASS